VSAGIPHLGDHDGCTKKYRKIVHSDHQQIVIHHGYFPILIYYYGGTVKKPAIIPEFYPVGRKYSGIRKKNGKRMF
jgi:hypothetical protein